MEEKTRIKITRRLNRDRQGREDRHFITKTDRKGLLIGRIYSNDYQMVVEVQSHPAVYNMH